jgi:cellulose synthase operon protein C
LKFFRKASAFIRVHPRPFLAVALLTATTLALRADLSELLQNVDSSSRLQTIFFRNVALPSGLVPVRRPPKETRAGLTRLINAAPSDAELVSLRALEAEQQLDFAAAETDWNKYVDLAQDKGAARIALADYYHRRLQPKDEFTALTLAAREPTPAAEQQLPAQQQKPWKTYARLIALVDEQNLDINQGATQYGFWLLRYAKEPSVYQGSFAYTIAHKLFDQSTDVIAAYQKAFPQDEEWPVAARAELASKVGTPAQALAALDRDYRPLWPPALIKKYFDLLRANNALRVYLERARTGAAANPADVQYAARLFHYWQQQGNPAAAERALNEYRQRKESRQSPWTANELLVMARLFESSGNQDEAARNYYALYSTARSDESMAETALGSLARLLLSAPEQPIHFGSGNLSLYHDVATMDPHPGFLNGALSLLLNETDPPNQEAIQEQRAAPYFRRAKAAELVSLFESRFPNSSARSDLRARVIESYAVYGSNDGVIRSGSRFLTDFPNATNRTEVALRMADAYARTNQIPQELAVYDLLLAELAKRSNGIPLGAQSSVPQAEPSPEKKDQPGSSANSPEYARVLDRYIARLSELKRVRDAMAIYRREIDRNANDPGLYDAMAAFLEQNSLTAETEQVYQRAIAQFQDHSWQHKLARWYLRQRRQADVVRMSRDVTRIFSGTELEHYFDDVVVSQAPLGPAIYLQLNLAAHQRFPHHMSFVRNLLTAYTTTATRDDLAYETILRQNWYEAADLRQRFFERLSSRGRLDAELSITRTANPAANAGRWQEAVDQSPATARMLAEGEAWRSHFEIVAPIFEALETDYPADESIGVRTASVYRSLGTIDPKLTGTALAVEAKLAQSDPHDHTSLTRMGEMEADLEQFQQVRAVWDKIPGIEPNQPGGYLETATLYWDYYQYAEAIRWIEEGRKRLGQPNLFAYEAGAIRENQRDYNRAIAEYARGALIQPDSNSQKRLLTLARRPALKTSIETLTDNLVSGRNPDLNALRLRVALLKDQNRRDDLGQFLLQASSRADSPDVLAELQETARALGFTQAQQSALERRIAVTSDPVDRMSLRLALARFHEGQGQPAPGAQVIDAVYRENPAILGVVRAAVDYNWRNKNPRRSIDVLEEAASRAEPGYRARFTLEATRKANESGDYTRARAFATKLLAAEPYNAEYVSAMAAIYAKQGDDTGLKAFYTTRIKDLATAPIPAAERIEQTAELRRALIPVLARTRDFTGAVDQYIEILNRYPEDANLTREAANFARINNVNPRLHDYYAKTATDSPKDFRWPMVLARIEMQMEDYPAAIGSYTRASAVRPDRVDLLTERLNLEEHLMRFDDAAATAEKLYELTYRNPQWMQKLAELRARQGQTAAAVAALNKAWIEGRPDRAQSYFDVARQLESWNMLPEARQAAEKGMTLAGNDEIELQGGIHTWVRTLVRLRDYNTALARMAPWQPGITSMAARDLGATVAIYYSPEEKAKFAAAIERQGRRIEIARTAGLPDLEAKWIYQALLAQPVSNQSAGLRQRLIELQQLRLRFEELGQQMEAYDRALLAQSQGNELQEAAAAYRASGNTGAELRVLQRWHARSLLTGATFDRYALLLSVQPQRTIAAITQDKRPESGNGLVNYTLSRGSAALAQQAITARGAVLANPLWTQAYTSLAGLYFTSNAAPVNAAFNNILGDMTIGSRVGKPLDRDKQLAGDQWFYYGGRYGEYLSAIKQPGADDYLPAPIEATPGQSQAYFDLAEYHRESGNPTAAAADYRNALELRPTRADVHDRLAVIAAQAGRAGEAAAEWKLALAALTNMMNRSAVPQQFWQDLNQTIRHAGDARMIPALRPDLDTLLTTYVRRNGAYQFDAVADNLVNASPDAGIGLTWILDLSKSASDQVRFLSVLLDRDWVTPAQKDSLYARIVEAAQAQAAQKFGDEQLNARRELWNWQLAWADNLYDLRQTGRAAQLLAQIPVEARIAYQERIVSLEIRLAVRSNSLAKQLAQYEEPVPIDSLRAAAAELQRESNPAPARRVLEYVYLHELNVGRLDMSNFLGLAEVRLGDNDVPAAVQLLRRMALVSPPPHEGGFFDELEPAASLLEQNGHPKEAGEFLTAWVKAEPWSSAAKMRLATVQGSVPALTEVATSQQADYATRLNAARAIRALKGDPLTAADPELIAISSQQLPADVQTASPYASNLRAAVASIQRDPATQERLLLAVAAVDVDTSRLPIFKAALAARHDPLAAAIGRSMLPAYLRDQNEVQPNAADTFLKFLPGPDRLTVARGLGEVNQRLGNAKAALRFYLIAQQIQASDPVKRSADTLRAQLDLELRNAARRPLVSNNIDQDHLVRPREAK